MEAYLGGLFIGFIWGGCAGIWLQKKAMHNILRIKSMDGTGEHIGKGEFVWILNRQDYHRIVLGINNEQSPTQE